MLNRSLCLLYLVWIPACGTVLKSNKRVVGCSHKQSWHYCTSGAILTRAGQSWRVQHPVPGKTTHGFSPAVPSGTVKTGRQGEFQKPNVLRKTLGHWEERWAMWRSCGRCISWWCQLCVSEVSTAPGEELKDNPMLEHLLPAKTISETQIYFAQNNSYTKFAYFGWHILFLY